LKSLHKFTGKPGQVVLADFEQQFIPALAIASAISSYAGTEYTNSFYDNLKKENTHFYSFSYINFDN
jgi:hypothetical protein